MQQLPAPIEAPSPSFSHLVLGTMLGYFSCFLATILLSICLFAVLTMLGLAAALPRLPQNFPVR